jgi:hypothetical protein
LVPDSIDYPVRNENYNPRAAQLNFKINVLGDSESNYATKEEKEKFNKDKAYLETVLAKAGSRSASDAKPAFDFNQLNEAVNAAQAKVNEAEAAFNTAKDPDKGKAKDALDKANGNLTKAQTALKQATDASKKAVPEGVDPLLPYVINTFPVEVAPCETRLCTNFTEYTNNFGTFSVNDPQYSGHRALTHAVYGFFLNGGMRCFVTRVKGTEQLPDALKMVDSIDEVTLVAAPGLDKNKQTWGDIVDHCEKAQDRFAILDYDEDVTKLYDKKYKFESYDKFQTALEQLTYDKEPNALPQRSNYAAFYFPWIEVIDPAKQLQDQDPVSDIDTKYQGRVYVPPSGHIAGIYARTDVERGVHKAPANCAIRGAINVKYYVSKAHQEGLNPQGVNCIRNMNGNIAFWGARTIGGDHNLEFKYINVRRVMLFLRESIDEGTQWVVFETNDIALWGKIKRNVSAFLTNVWRSGALFGATPEEAFYVKCDAELNPPEVRDLGQVITEIGVAIVRPAEFVIFRISQSTGAKA